MATQHVTYMLSPRHRYLFVYRDGQLTSSMVIMRSMVIIRSEQPTKCFVPLQKLRARKLGS